MLGASIAATVAGAAVARSVDRAGAHLLGMSEGLAGGDVPDPLAYLIPKNPPKPSPLLGEVFMYPDERPVRNNPREK